MYPSLFTVRPALILASSSPRRQQFMQEWGIPYTLDVPGGGEPKPLAGETPALYVNRAATIKGQAVAARHPQEIILAADTVVALANEILGKPRNPREALSMLKKLSGQTHQVITGVYLKTPVSEEIFSVATSVTFAPWTHEILAAYVRTGEPMDKAGAYAIQGQGAFLVEKIEGSWTAVVGLPVTEVAERLRAAGMLTATEE